VFFEVRDVSTNKPMATTKSKSDKPPRTGLIGRDGATGVSTVVEVEVLRETSGTGTLFKGIPVVLFSKLAAVPGWTAAEFWV